MCFFWFLLFYSLSVQTCGFTCLSDFAYFWSQLKVATVANNETPCKCPWEWNLFLIFFLVFLCLLFFFFTLPLTADATKLRIRHVAATPTVAAPRSHPRVPQGCPEATFNFLWPFNLSLTIYKVYLACNFSIRSLFSSVLMCVYGGLWCVWANLQGKFREFKVPVETGITVWHLQTFTYKYVSGTWRKLLSRWLKNKSKWLL